MNKSDFWFKLPEELIAQTPTDRRGQSRLLYLDKRTGKTQHHRFTQLPEFLKKDDCLVLNDSRVLPARLLGRKETGGAAEVVLLRDLGDDVWECLTRPGKRVKTGTNLIFGDGELKGAVISVSDSGNRHIKFKYKGIFLEVLERLGKMPLPPYIHEELEDAERYQTVYSKPYGSAAAPTAGLHFTKEMLDRINSLGVKLCYITLHVGLGTFRPVKAEAIKEHKMHAEYFIITDETAETINRAKAAGSRVIAVGTTSCRALETSASKTQKKPENVENSEKDLKSEKKAAHPATNSPLSTLHSPRQKIAPHAGFTDIFIYPGYEFACIDGMITNFHLPESTLIMLVSAFAGRENTLQAYAEAIRERYRFYSFGDAMLIL